MSSRAAFLIPLLLLTVCQDLPAAETHSSNNIVPYRIDHSMRASGTLPAISIEHGQILQISIDNTAPECFLYNAREETRPTLEAGAPSTVILDIVHDESTAAYIVDVTKKSTDSRCTLGERNWRIPVRPAWSLVGAGGFAGHDLTSPVFFLEAGERQRADGTKEQGFFVRERKNAADSNQVVGAAFLHLYRSSRSWKGITLAPISFGLAVDSSRSDYLLGTSLRFGDRAYLSLGRIFGTVKRLPDSLGLNDFTTNANALGTPPARREEGWFVSLSYGFLEGGVSNLFRNRLGIPQVNQASQASQAGTGGTPPPASAPQVAVTPSSGSTGTEVKITAQAGLDFGGQSDDSYVEVKDATGKQYKMQSKELALSNKWQQREITIVIPTEVKPGKATITVYKDAQAAGSTTFTVS